MADPRLRQIKIKSGVVKRLAKEKTVYEKEAELQRKRVNKLKDEGKDEHDIRKQEEVLQESLMMVPDCQRRLLKNSYKCPHISEEEKLKCYDLLSSILGKGIRLKKTRLATAFTDLKNILLSEEDLKENEDYLAAQNILMEAEKQLPEVI